MNLVGAAVNLRAAETMSRVQYAVARKLLNSQRAQGDAAVQLIQAAGQIASKSADELAVAASGLGGTLDTYG